MEFPRRNSGKTGLVGARLTLVRNKGLTVHEIADCIFVNNGKNAQFAHVSSINAQCFLFGIHYGPRTNVTYHLIGPPMYSVDASKFGDPVIFLFLVINS